MQELNNPKITSADMESAFSYLLESGFKIAGQSTSPSRAGIGYLGEQINISLSFEYREANFDFAVIDSKDPAVHRPIWRILKYFYKDISLDELTPDDINDKTTLNNVAKKFQTVLQAVKDNPRLLDII